MVAQQDEYTREGVEEAIRGLRDEMEDVINQREHVEDQIDAVVEAIEEEIEKWKALITMAENAKEGE